LTPPNNPRVARVAMIMQRDTRQVVNTFHVQKTAAWTAGDLSSLALAVKVWWTTYYKPMIPSQYALTQIQVRVYDPVAPLAYDLNVSPPEAGTRGTTPEAGNVTLSMSTRTGYAGRKFRGRMYLAGIGTGDISVTDTVVSALSTLAANAIATLIASALPAGMALTLFHRFTNTFTDITAYVIENVVDSQRRRLPGRGR
jgi:hypothetical protein